jgi:hypothetical protein
VESGATSVSLSVYPRVKNYSNKIHSETNSKVERSPRRLLNALASNAAPAPNLLAPAAILSSSVRAGLAFSGEADPPTGYIWSARRGETILLKNKELASCLASSRLLLLTF